MAHAREASGQVSGAESYNEKKLADGTLTWEMITELGRFWQQGHGLEVDGFIGAQTAATIVPVVTPPVFSPGRLWEPWDGPLSKQPRSRSEIYEMFGNPGTTAPSASWERANLVELHGSTRLPGVSEKWYVKLHKLVEPYAREGLRRAQISSQYTIERFGGYVFRHTRHDPAQPLSYHSWGIAFDVDPGRNYAKPYARGKAPKPWSPEWMALWPDGVDKAFVEALASCGWTWGGAWDFCDPMHWEWAGRVGV
jgi:hypothetical protein